MRLISFHTLPLEHVTLEHITKREFSHACLCQPHKKAAERCTATLAALTRVPSSSKNSARQHTYRVEQKRGGVWVGRGRLLLPVERSRDAAPGRWQGAVRDGRDRQAGVVVAVVSGVGGGWGGGEGSR